MTNTFIRKNLGYAIKFELNGNYLELPECDRTNFQGFAYDYNPGDNEYNISFWNDSETDMEIIQNFQLFIEENKYHEISPERESTDTL